MYYRSWRYYWDKYTVWCPFQTCAICQKWYWAGLPYPSLFAIRLGRFWQWLPGWNDYCSKECCDVDMEIIDEFMNGV